MAAKRRRSGSLGVPLTEAPGEAVFPPRQHQHADLPGRDKARDEQRGSTTEREGESAIETTLCYGRGSAARPAAACPCSPPTCGPRCPALPSEPPAHCRPTAPAQGLRAARYPRPQHSHIRRLKTPPRRCPLLAAAGAGRSGTEQGVGRARRRRPAGLSPRSPPPPVPTSSLRPLLLPRPGSSERSAGSRAPREPPPVSAAAPRARGGRKLPRVRAAPPPAALCAGLRETGGAKGTGLGKRRGARWLPLPTSRGVEGVRAGEDACPESGRVARRPSLPPPPPRRRRAAPAPCCRRGGGARGTVGGRGACVSVREREAAGAAP